MSKLVIFDCDGTLVDSQHLIVDVMYKTFETAGLAPPTRAQSRGIIGLSLSDAMAELAPQLTHEDHVALARSFEGHFRELRADPNHQFEPLYEGIPEALAALSDAGYLMAVATGKSLRGLRAVLAEHNIGDHFISLQTADHHPSKPHPSMVHTCLADGGVDARDSVVVGDTSFDMAMARSAGSYALGVTWGYHDDEGLKRAGAHDIVADADTIIHRVQSLIGPV